MDEMSARLMMIAEPTCARKCRLEGSRERLRRFLMVSPTRCGFCVNFPFLAGPNTKPRFYHARKLSLALRFRTSERVTERVNWSFGCYSDMVEHSGPHEEISFFSFGFSPDIARAVGNGASRAVAYGWVVPIVDLVVRSRFWICVAGVDGDGADGEYPVGSDGPEFVGRLDFRL